MKFPFKICVDLDTASKGAQVVLAFASFLGVAIGGWWTIHVYDIEDEGKSHLTLNQSVTVRHLTKDADLAVVSLTVTNAGTVPVSLQCLYIEVRRVLPFVPPKAGLPSDLDTHTSVVTQEDDANDEAADWPLLKWAERKYGNDGDYLEPTEQSTFTETLAFSRGNKTVETTSEMEDNSPGETCVRDPDGLVDELWWASTVTDIP